MRYACFVCIWSFFSLMVPLVGYASDPSSTCAQLFRQEQHKLAAECYTQIAAKMPTPDKLDDLQKKRKGLFLENAAKAYQKHAAAQKEAQEQRYYYEKAAEPLRSYLQERLCVKAYRCQAIKGMLFDLDAKIGYAALTLTNSLAETARVEIKGYQFEREVSLSGQENLRLRPGVYQVRVTYPKQATQYAEVTLGERETRLFEAATMGKGPYKQGLTGGQIGGIVLIAGGIALLGGGLTFVFVSKNIEKDLDGLFAERFSVNAARATLFTDLKRDAHLSFNAGVIGLALGAVVIGGGILWFRLAAPQKKAETSNKTASQWPVSSAFPLATSNANALPAQRLYTTPSF